MDDIDLSIPSPTGVKCKRSAGTSRQPSFSGPPVRFDEADRLWAGDRAEVATRRGPRERSAERGREAAPVAARPSTRDLLDHCRVGAARSMAEDLDAVLQATVLGDAKQNVAVPTLVADENGQYIAVNEAACALTGYSRKAAHDRGRASLLHPARPARSTASESETGCLDSPFPSTRPGAIRHAPLCRSALRDRRQARPRRRLLDRPDRRHDRSCARTR